MGSDGHLEVKGQFYPLEAYRTNVAKNCVFFNLGTILFNISNESNRPSIVLTK